ncbi:MAG: hypothetical protein WBL50_27995, partial [Candidatus Acidiferrum sp.]
MADKFQFAQARAVSPAPISRELRFGLYFGFAALLASLLAALFVPEGFALNAFGDSLQVLLVAAATSFAFRNFLRSHSRARIFWFLIFAGALQWTVSNAIWA